MKTLRSIHVLLVAAALLSGAIKSTAATADDALRRALPAPELYVKHRQALALTDAQAATLRTAMETLTRESRELMPVLEARTRELAAAVEDAAASADTVQRRLDAVLETENKLKAARLRASLTARRALGPEQWKKLNELRGSAAAAEPASTGEEPTRTDLQKKLQRVRELMGAFSAEGPPPEMRRLFNEAQTKARAGRTAEADRVFDRIIAGLEQRIAEKSAATPKP